MPGGGHRVSDAVKTAELDCDRRCEARMVRTKPQRAQVMPLLLRVPDVAILLGISEREVWGMLQRGELPKVPVPGRRMTRVAREDVERLVARWRGRASDGSAKTL